MNVEARQTILFVDYENRKLDLRQIPAEVLVHFYLGAAEKSVPVELFRSSRELGDRFVHVDIEGQGKNALDFHIAFYLGEILSSEPTANCIILSGDQGFDPLVKHLRGRGFSVKRAETIAEAFGTSKPKAEKPKAEKPKAAPAVAAVKTEAASPYPQIVKWLKEMQPRTRPKKRKGLIAHMKSHFEKTIPEATLIALIDQLVAEKKINEVDGKLGYRL